MMNVVVLAAGEGSRFKKEGYSSAKPFIKIGDKMMIERVIDGVAHPGAHIIVVIRKSFLQEYSNEIACLYKNCVITRISTVEGLTRGALCTALSAYETLDMDKPVVFVDVDNIFDKQCFGNFIRFSIESKNDANLLVFKSNSPKFSYALVDPATKLVVRTKEKEAISTSAIAGAYMFSSAALFVRNAIDTLIYESQYSEYYMSAVYNTIAKKGLRIGTYDIAPRDFSCVGTPEQLRSFLKTNYSDK